MRTKRILKIYNRIIQIVQKGRDAKLEYMKFIQDTIDNGEYSLLQDLFDTHFDTNIRKYPTLSMFKSKSFDVVRYNTNSSFQYRLKLYYDSSDVYQMGKSIYDNTTNELLGEFAEIDRLSYINSFGVTYSYNPENIYYKDTYLMKKQIKDTEENTNNSEEARLVELYVTIGLQSYGDIVILNDPTMELLDKYKLAITLLRAGNYSINTYIEDNYIDDYYI
jgi:hypothetical protein